LLELLQLGRGRSLRGSSGLFGSDLRDGRGLRCQRGKLRPRGRDHRSGCIAIPLPSQSCTDTTENTIRKRTRPREALLPSHGRIAPKAEPALASSPGRARSGWSAVSRKRPPTLASSPSTSAGFWPMRSRKCATVKSFGNLGGVGVTVESIGTPPVFQLVCCKPSSCG